MGPRERIKLGAIKLGVSQTEMAGKIGTSKQEVSHVASGRYTHGKIVEGVAKYLGCTTEWLVSGRGEAPDWYRDSFQEPSESKALPSLIGNFAFSGRVTAGGGFVHTESGPSTIELKNGLQAVLVEGDSAYPVVFPGQYVIVDGTRGPSDGNLVVCQTEDGQALLKRYLLDKKSPGGFALVSVNIGQSIHTFTEDQQPRIWPVVGVLFPKAFKREPA